MARMRSLKPEFWTDRKLARRSRDARLLYLALWNQADEWARVQGDTRYIKGHCLPYDDDLNLDDIDRLLAELDEGGNVQRYDVDGDPYLFLPKLGRHQRLEPLKVPSRLPDPPPPGTNKSAPRTNVSARGLDETDAAAVLDYDGDAITAGQRASSEPRANESAPVANTSETIVAKHVAGSSKHVKTVGAKPRTNDTPAGFAEFWTAYPRKIGKPGAIKAYARALQRTDATSLLAAAVAFGRTVAGKDQSFTPHPATWLNDDRWDVIAPKPRSVNEWENYTTFSDFDSKGRATRGSA